jgi:hypothetical protein
MDEPYIRLGGLADFVEGILRCRRIVFIGGFAVPA